MIIANVHQPNIVALLCMQLVTRYLYLVTKRDNFNGFKMGASCRHIHNKGCKTYCTFELDKINLLEFRDNGYCYPSTW